MFLRKKVSQGVMGQPTYHAPEDATVENNPSLLMKTRVFMRVKIWFSNTTCLFSNYLKFYLGLFFHRTI